MKQSWAKKVLGAVFLILLLPLVFSLWLSGTETGLNFVYRYATNYIPGNISIAKLEGSLISTLTANNIQYNHNGMAISADKLTLKWRPAALMSTTIDIRELHLQSLNVKLPSTDESHKKDKLSTIPEINLPWRIALKNVVVDDFSLSLSAKTEPDFKLKQIKLNAATSYEQVNIKSLLLKTDYAELNIKGQINPNNNFQHKLKTKWSTKYFADATFEGNGNIEGNINTLKIHQQVTGPVQVTFKADVHDLLEKLNWHAEANFKNKTSSEKWPEWPAQLKGKIISQAQTKNGELIAYVDIPQITGTLRGYPVSLKSHLDLNKAGININHFQLRSGKTLLGAKGRVDSKINVNWTLSSPNLAELYPHALGQLHAQGQLLGTPSLPKLFANFDAKTLSLSDYKINRLNGKVDLDLFRWQQVKIDFAAKSLKLKEYELQSLDVTANNNKLQVKAISNLATTLLELKGDINTLGLQGSIEKADLLSSHFADWKLTTPATFKINKEHFSLDPLCWQSLEGKACATVKNKNQSWLSQIEISKLPLIFFSNWLPTDIKLEGVSDINAEFQYSRPDHLQGQAHIVFPAGVVSYPVLGGEHERLKYRGGTVDIVLSDKGLDANSEITINNDNHFKGQLTLPELKLLTIDSIKQTIQASAQLNVNDLSFIEAFIPETQNIKGDIGLNFDVSGTLAHPKLKGKASLLNGSLQIPRLGLNINKLNLNAQSDGLEKLDFQLAAQSGEGNITIQGQTVLDRLDGWPTTINIKGEKFEVSHIPVSHLVVSPELKIKLQKHTININGTVHVPYAKLQPKDITTAIRVSDDTLIIGSEQAIDEKWLVYTKVRLTLGERVHFYGFGFEGRFGGSLLLQDEPGQLTKAIGEINVPEGRYAAYGQQLQVEHGRLLYTNSPITNPGLDLRAVRHIGDISAGLKVRGTLNHPQIELFSIPAMGQTDMLAYLLLGRPIENATGKEGEMMTKAALALSLVGGDSLARTLGTRFGIDEMRVESSSSGDQASLIIGRYLSPKLYVGYGVGLIESFNTFNVRYQISNKWQLKGESGENQGADILYTIER